MRLNTTPTDIATMSNVNDLSEYKINTSAKAFSILSSGIYANKIRAIIRELACNAYDSHVEAGKKDVPFDFHLPTYLEPYFSIRDYGVGLSNDQVFDIYTTYFESTKTNSNDFVGALGLGSKSPFSYTDNFSITAIKDGQKNIYSAFINENGCPSIVKMGSSKTDEQNGVEIKFSVNSSDDYFSFVYETKEVFKHFDVIPNFTGEYVNVPSKSYKEKNIIPNVHVFDGYNYSSHAVMGNVSYPIDRDSIKNHIDQTLVKYFDMGLEFVFNIGDIDFQPSREGLSYNKQTITAFETKLQELKDKLDGILFAEADSIENMWERAKFLVTKANTKVWVNSVVNYVKTNNIEDLVNITYSNQVQTGIIEINENDLATKYNIAMKQFIVDKYSEQLRTEAPTKKYNTTFGYTNVISINIDPFSKFICNDKPRGGIERAKYHIKNKKSDFEHRSVVTVMHSIDNDKPAKYDEFFKDIYNPPAEQILKNEDLLKKPVNNRNTSRQKGSSIIRLDVDYSVRYNSSYVWKENVTVDLSDTQTKYYYIPLHGFSPINQEGFPPIDDIKEFFDDISTIGIMRELKSEYHLYGVRKADLEFVKSMPNWINIQEAVKDTLKTIVDKSVMNTFMSEYSQFKATITVIRDKLPDGSYSKTIADNICNGNDPSSSLITIKSYIKDYWPDYDFETTKANIKKECAQYVNKYPLIRHISYSYYDKKLDKDLIDYINMIDNQGEK